MSNLVWLKLNTPEGKPLLVCANNITNMVSDGTATAVNFVGVSDFTLYVRETLEEIAKLLE